MEPLGPPAVHEEVLVEDIATARAFRRRELTLWLLVGLFAIATMVVSVLAATHWYSGPPLARVPDITNLSQPSALQDLERAGFSVKIERRVSDVASGTVLEQRPEKRAVLSKGSFVTIFVSRGKSEVPVPRLVGLRAEAARVLLVTLDLQGQPTDVKSNEPKGIVIDQEPEAGVRVAKGDQVFYSVSTGPTP